MMGGWRFYLDETSQVTPTTSTDAMAKPETTTFSSPRIDSADPVAQEVQRVHRGRSRASWRGRHGRP